MGGLFSVEMRLADDERSAEITGALETNACVDNTPSRCAKFSGYSYARKYTFLDDAILVKITVRANHEATANTGTTLIENIPLVAGPAKRRQGEAPAVYIGEDTTPQGSDIAIVAQDISYRQSTQRAGLHINFQTAVPLRIVTNGPRNAAGLQFNRIEASIPLPHSGRTSELSYRLSRYNF